MTVKISITLPEELLDDIDKRSSRFKNRSNFIEDAIRAYIAKIVLDKQNARDLAIINREANRLNKEAADVLAYQVMGQN
jgi:metal-responsive CopG/Arc/MetJ family transcriptional regulator